jgi:hypothetical protein
MAKADGGGGHVRVKVPTDDGCADAALVQAEEGCDVDKNNADDGGGHVHVQAHTDEGVGAVQVTERGDMAKVPVEEGAVLTKMVDRMEVTWGDKIVLHRGGDAIHATVDVVGEVAVIKNITSGDEDPFIDDLMGVHT